MKKLTTLFALLAFAASAHAAATVTGTVLDASETAVPGAIVIFASDDTPQAATGGVIVNTAKRVRANASGAFSVQLAEGNYYVTVDRPDFTDFWIAVPEGTGTYDWEDLTTTISIYAGEANQLLSIGGGYSLVGTKTNDILAVHSLTNGPNITIGVTNGLATITGAAGSGLSGLTANHILYAQDATTAIGSPILTFDPANIIGALVLARTNTAKAPQPVMVLRDWDGGNPIAGILPPSEFQLVLASTNPAIAYIGISEGGHYAGSHYIEVDGTKTNLVSFTADLGVNGGGRRIYLSTDYTNVSDIATAVNAGTVDNARLTISKNSGIQTEGVYPHLRLRETDATSGGQAWELNASGGEMALLLWPGDGFTGTAFKGWRVARDPGSTNILSQSWAGGSKLLTLDSSGLTLDSGGFIGIGSGLTALNASNLGSGTVPDGRLPAEVPLTDEANDFTDKQMFLRSGSEVHAHGSQSGALNISWNTNAHTVTATGNLAVTMNGTAPTSGDLETRVLVFTQDGVGGHTLTVGGSSVPVNSAASAVTYVTISTVDGGSTLQASGRNDVVDDTTPQLGGDLDVNGNRVGSPDGTDGLDIVNGSIDAQTANSSRLDINDSGVRLGGSGARVTTILDEDNMTSDSATSLATQQSIKAYVDTTNTGTHTTPSTSDPLAPTWNGPTHIVYYNAAGEIDLPAASGYSNRGIIVYNTGSNLITIDPNASEVIVRAGVVQTGGVSITLAAGAGNYVALVSDGTRWITLGYLGTLSEGS